MIQAEKLALKLVLGKEIIHSLSLSMLLPLVASLISFLIFNNFTVISSFLRVSKMNECQIMSNDLSESIEIAIWFSLGIHTYKWYLNGIIF